MTFDDVSRMRMLMENLRSLRIQRGFATQEALAERCGLSQSTISLLESGKMGWRVNTLVVVADALGVTLDEVMRATMKPKESQVS